MSVLNALLGGLGRGATAWGNAKMQEDELLRRNLLSQEQQRIQREQIEAQKARDALLAANQERLASRQAEADALNAFERGFRPVSEVQTQGRALSQTPPGMGSVSDMLMGAQGGAMQAARPIEGTNYTKGAYSMQEQRDRMLAQQRAEERAFDAATRAAERASQNEFMAGESAKNRALQRELTNLRLDGSGQPTLRVLPQALQRTLDESLDTLSAIRNAKGELDTPEAKGAFGWKNVFAETVLPASLENVGKNLLDPDGINARGAVANVRSVIQKIRSGQAVTASEMSLLKPYLPTDMNSLDELKIKLPAIEREYDKMIRRRLAQWGRTYDVPSPDDLLGAGLGDTPSATQQAGQRQYSPNNPFAGGRP